MNPTIINQLWPNTILPYSLPFNYQVTSKKNEKALSLLKDIQNFTPTPIVSLFGDPLIWQFHSIPESNSRQSFIRSVVFSKFNRTLYQQDAPLKDEQKKTDLSSLFLLKPKTSSCNSFQQSQNPAKFNCVSQVDQKRKNTSASCLDQNEEDSVNYFKMQFLRKRKQIKQISSQLGHWSSEEHKLYLKFLEENREIFNNRLLKKSKKIFKQMSKIITTRTAAQCRSHHQKFQPQSQFIQDLENNKNEKLVPNVPNKNISQVFKKLPAQPSQRTLCE